MICTGQVDVNVYSHGASIVTRNPAAVSVIKEMALSLSAYKTVKQPPSWRVEKVFDRSYRGRSADKETNWISVFQVPELLSKLRYARVPNQFVKLTVHKPNHGVAETFKWISEFEPYDYQRLIIDQLLASKSYVLDPDQLKVDNLTVTNLQTGKGKTLTAIRAMYEYGQRTLLYMRAAHIPTWVESLQEYLGLRRGELCVVSGTDQLISIINLAKNGDFNYKATIISSGTYLRFVKAYEMTGDVGKYGCTPIELCELLGIGFRIVDEFHEELHAGIKAFIYSHVSKALILSATLNSDDPLTRRVYEAFVPQDKWVSGIEYDAYVHVTGIFYRHNPQDVSKIRTTEKGGSHYSHGAYEKWLMEDEGRLERYLKMLYELYRSTHLDAKDYDPQHKAIVFCALVDFCQVVRDYFQAQVEERGMTVGIYVAESKEEELHGHDVVVTTRGSAGTGKDVKNLRSLYRCTAIRKREANEQIKGRLRRMKKFPDVKLQMYYLMCSDISKHMEYHHDLVEQYEGVCASHRSVPYKGII